MTNTLIVEDEPLLCRAYETILKEIQSNEELESFKVSVCTNYVSAINFLKSSNKSKEALELCLLDYRLNTKNTENENGLTIGQKIREVYPNCKIVVITSISDNYLLNRIIEKLNPSGFLIKTDIDYDTLKKDLLSILKGTRIYSKEINDFIQRRRSVPAHRLDQRDLSILRLMERGLSLPKIGTKVGLSLSGVEYRKRVIARNIGAPSSNKEDLLEFVKNELNLL